MLASRACLSPSLRRGLTHPALPKRPPYGLLAKQSFPSSLSRPITRHLTSDIPTSSPKSSKWIRLIPVAAVIGATVFIFTSKNNKEDDGEEKFDTEKLYASKSTTNIALSWLILKLCSYDFVVNYGPKLLDWATEHHLSGIAYWVMKQTFFKHFVAGETLEETVVATDKLKKDGMGVVLDYSIEAGSGTVEELDKVARGILSTVDAAARDPFPAFACLKVSGLTSFSLLLRLSQIITYHNNAKSLPPIPMSEADKIPNEKYLTRVLPPSPPSLPPPPLTPSEIQELAELEARLDIICGNAHKNNVAILFDAEQTYYQPAIDYLAIYYSKKYNKVAPIVYNTYQMYLKDGPARLQTDVSNAQQQGYLLGIKIVRGAYMHTERERAKQMKYTDPIAPTINDTHANYYRGLEIAFSNLSTVGVMIASHNETTVVQTIDRLKNLHVDPKNSRVQFAQLYGMGDHLSFLVVQNGFRVFKYVPFGPIEHVIPYLVRRMQENRGFIGSASDKERRLLWRELRRRLSFRPATSAPASPVVPTRGAL
eukprot:Phypoly_transcript_04559.p1 GENE.Phypoly_transcript_04559~~Phypoly_transcript_04559.p1  ORF type:complete len:538 (+),score=62.19 Phypoly_transcript_04559:308-1921(+)